jgi:WD40 repeat protein
MPRHRLTSELVQTSHSERVNDLAFPHEYSEVFATAGVGNIRVWHLATCRELLRIEVPNLECNCVIFSTVRVCLCVSTGLQTAKQVRHSCVECSDARC